MEALYKIDCVYYNDVENINYKVFQYNFVEKDDQMFGNTANDVENRTLSQQISESITMQIVQGTYKPGERLFEGKLTELFGTSRAPIREALYILEKEGIVEKSPRRGVFVKNYSQKEIFELYDVIYRMEEIALERACQHITQKQLEYLGRLIDQMKKEVELKKVSNYFELMEKLQKSFFDASNNDVLKEVYVNLIKRITPFRYMSLSHPSSLENSIEEYKGILSGLEQRNWDEVRYHLRRKEKRAIDLWKQKDLSK